MSLSKLTLYRSVTKNRSSLVSRFLVKTEDGNNVQQLLRQMGSLVKSLESTVGQRLPGKEAVGEGTSTTKGYNRGMMKMGLNSCCIRSKPRLPLGHHQVQSGRILFPMLSQVSTMHEDLCSCKS